MEILALPLLAVVAGFVSFSSPCCLPLVPGYLSYVSALPVSELAERDARRVTVGPVLATILATAAASRSVAWGAVLLVLYSVGLGIPFVLLALGFSRAQRSLAWLRRNGRRIEIAGGALLVAVGVLFVTGRWQPLFRPLQRWFAELGWPPI